MGSMDSKQLAKLCSELADNKKAENILVLDVRKLSTITDFFVIVSGTSSPHLRAIVNEIDDKLRADHELRPRALDGNWSCLFGGRFCMHELQKMDTFLARYIEQFKRILTEAFTY